MPTINILGVSHAYELIPSSSNSSKPVLIFVHGWLLSRQYWSPLIKRLSKKYSCLIYDLRGFGDSQPINNFVSQEIQISSPYSPETYAKDLVILLEKLKIHKSWLIGHSVGGNIALWGAELCPEKVQGVICLNVGGGIYLKEEFERFLLVGQQLIRYKPTWLLGFPVVKILFSKIIITNSIARRWGKQRVIDLIKANPIAALSSLLNSTTEKEVHVLPQIVACLSQPVYFLAGGQDRLIESQYVRYLASFHKLFSFQGKNVIDFPNCGHMPMIEKPELLEEKMLGILIAHKL